MYEHIAHTKCKLVTGLCILQQTSTVASDISFYNLVLKKWGYTGFGLSAIPSVRRSVSPSIILLFSTQYLKNTSIEFKQSLNMH